MSIPCGQAGGKPFVNSRYLAAMGVKLRFWKRSRETAEAVTASSLNAHVRDAINDGALEPEPAPPVVPAKKREPAKKKAATPKRATAKRNTATSRKSSGTPKK